MLLMNKRAMNELYKTTKLSGKNNLCGDATVFSQDLRLSVVHWLVYKGDIWDSIPSN